MTDATQKPAPQGPRCTLTIETGEAGVTVACDFGGPLNLGDLWLTQMLAMAATGAIQDQLATLRHAGAVTSH